MSEDLGLPAGAGSALPDAVGLPGAWVGRLVRVLVLFRSMVLLVTIIVLPQDLRRPAVAAAVIAAALISYVPIRHWDRISESVARHPAYLAVEVVISTFVLAAVGVRSPFFYFTLGTAALAGVIYGRRGAFPFSALLIALYELVALEGLPTFHPHVDAETILFAPMLYPLAMVAGLTARETIERGARSEALLREHSEALSAERERLAVARELHDSLAKTVEGLAMTASVLPGRCRKDPDAAAELARSLAADARQAALEARMLMSDLRPGAELPVQEALRRRAAAFSERSGTPVELSACEGLDGLSLSPQATHELVRILGEALTNAATHGNASHVRVSVERVEGLLELAIADDGSGIEGSVDLDRLKSDGHFGLAGMNERARSIGAKLGIQSGERGTLVTLRLPLSGAVSAAPAPTAARRRWTLRRRNGRDAPAPALAGTREPT